MIPSGVLPVLYCSQYDIGRPLGMVVYNRGEAVNLSTYTCTIEATRTDGTAITAAVTTDGNIGEFSTTATMTNVTDRYPAKLVIVDGGGNRVASLAFVMCVTPATMDENAESIEEDQSLYQQYTGTVQTLIATERQQRQSADNALQSNINAEASARAAGDSNLSAAINTEASARQSADNQLQFNINAEASTRATQDASLQSQINQLIAPSGSAPSAAEVQNARIGADGITYTTLGDAIRGQVGWLATDTDEANKGTFSFPVAEFTRGQIENGGDGTYYQNRIKLSAIHNTGNRYLVFESTDSAYSTRFTLYDSSGTYQSQTGFVQRYVIGPNQNYRLNIRRDADTDADHSTKADIALLSSKLVANTVLLDAVHDAYKGKQSATLLDFDMENGQLNSYGQNDDSAYNLTRKMRSVGYLYAKKGDVVTTSNTALRFTIAYYGINKIFTRFSGWQTSAYTVTESGYIRVSFGKISDGELEENLKLTYREAISISGNVNTALENIQLEMFENGSQGRQYSYAGEKIDVAKYSYDITALWDYSNPTTSGDFSAQASAYYNGVVFKLWNPDLMQLYNFETGAKIAEFAITSGHGNSIDFSTEFYDASDEFPLVYITADTNPATVYVNRVTRTGATLIRTLTFPLNRTGYYAGHCLDNINNVLYQIGYKNDDYQTSDNGNHMIVTKWDLSALTDNGDNTYTPAFIDTFDLPLIDTCQGQTMLNGKIFIVSANPYVGTGSGKTTKVYAIDVGGQRISNILTEFWERIRDHEGEGIFFVPNGNRYDMIVDIQLRGLFKITL